MSDEQYKLEQPVPARPASEGGFSISDIASTHAPFIYLDDAPVFGSMNGIVQVTLTSVRLMVNTAGTIVKDNIVVGHLRMNVEGAKSLKKALDTALLLASQSISKSMN